MECRKPSRAAADAFARPRASRDRESRDSRDSRPSVCAACPGRNRAKTVRPRTILAAAFAASTRPRARAPPPPRSPRPRATDPKRRESESTRHLGSVRQERQTRDEIGRGARRRLFVPRPNARGTTPRRRTTRVFPRDVEPPPPPPRRRFHSDGQTRKRHRSLPRPSREASRTTSPATRTATRVRTRRRDRTRTRGFRVGARRVDFSPILRRRRRSRSGSRPRGFRKCSRRRDSTVGSTASRCEARAFGREAMATTSKMFPSPATTTTFPSPFRKLADFASGLALARKVLEERETPWATATRWPTSRVTRRSWAFACFGFVWGGATRRRRGERPRGGRPNRRRRTRSRR